MNIIIGGDLSPTPANYEFFKIGDVISLVGQDLYNEWMGADFRLFNLETTLADVDSPIHKQGPALRAPSDTIAGIKALNPQLVCTANNHIYDHGKLGYSSTIELLNTNGIPFVGSGENLKQSSTPYIFSGEKKIGIYACADNEFTIATNNAPGANPFDPLESFDHIMKLKQNCDYVIVLYHGAKELYRYPSPYIQRICRKMAEKGADVIVLQHSHCIGCEELYNGSIILYGQGNFIFGVSSHEFSKTALLLKLSFEGGVKADYIPIVKNGAATRLADTAEADGIMSAFRERSEQILESGFIENEYDNFSRNYYSYYYQNLLRYPRWLKKLNSISNDRLLKYLNNKNHTLFLSDMITCDAHRELFTHIIKTEIEKFE